MNLLHALSHLGKEQGSQPHMGCLPDTAAWCTAYCRMLHLLAQWLMFDRCSKGILAPAGQENLAYSILCCICEK